MRVKAHLARVFDPGTLKDNFVVTVYVGKIKMVYRINRSVIEYSGQFASWEEDMVPLKEILEGQSGGGD